MIILEITCIKKIGIFWYIMTIYVDGSHILFYDI